MLFCLHGRASTTEKAHKFETNYLTKLSTPELDSLDIVGKITDSTGTAVEGVVITEKGTTNSTLSYQIG
jgi:hypothetical protein